MPKKNTFTPKATARENTYVSNLTIEVSEGKKLSISFHKDGGEMEIAIIENEEFVTAKYVDGADAVLRFASLPNVASAFNNLVSGKTL